MIKDPPITGADLPTQTLFSKLYFQNFIFKPLFSNPVVPDRVEKDQGKEAHDQEHEGEVAYGVPDEAYAGSSFFPGDQDCALEGCGDYQADEGQHEDEGDVKDLGDQAFFLSFCALFYSFVYAHLEVPP